MSDETLQVRKERVLAAAAKCSDAKRILGELFPEAFVSRFAVGTKVRPKGYDEVYTRLGGSPAAFAYYNKYHDYKSLYEGRAGAAVLVSADGRAWHTDTMDGYEAVD
jgi:hypothetical protein